jgi:hypothetical protein
MSDYRKQEATKLAGQISNLVNSSNFADSDMCKQIADSMRWEHRTLQQNLTRFCLAWINQ